MAINIDEGEPGTFKDRYYLERDPHRFLEGALDRGLGGRHRRDLHLSARRVSRLPRDSRAGDRGAAGESAVPDPADSSAPRRRRLHLRRRVRDDRIDRRQARRAAAASAVRRAGRACSTGPRSSTTWRRCTGCASIVEKGRRGSPATAGTAAKGLRSFSVSGRVKKPGVHLAPAGITVKELIDEYCGGMLDGHVFYGVPAGRRVGRHPAGVDGRHSARFRHPEPVRLLHRIGGDRDSFGPRTRRPDAARNLMKFFSEESCGQCTPCRVGTVKAVTADGACKLGPAAAASELSQAMVDCVDLRARDRQRRIRRSQ